MLVWIFVISVTGIAFTYAGYPLALALLARARPRPVRRAPSDAPVTIVIVAFNEVQRIGAKIRSCLAQNHPRAHLRVLVASDGSDDGTDAIVAGFRGEGVELLAFEARRGKAACLNDAVAACRDEFIVFSDVRQALDPDAVGHLLANFADPQVGAVSGELAFVAESVADFGEGVDAYWRYEKFIRQKESEIASVVGVSGALYAMRRSLWRAIPPQTILDDVMIPMNVVLQLKRVVFEKRALAWDRPSTSSTQERVRKVRTLAGNFQLFALRPEFLLPWRNPVFPQMVCHKLLRLLVPLLMALALLSNLRLAPRGMPWMLLLAAQVLGYTLAIAAVYSPALRRHKPLRLLAAFFQLNAFVVQGFVEFLSNRNLHRWRSG